MPIQQGANAQIIYAAESGFGVAASAGGTAQRLRYNPGSALNLTKDAFASNEVRPDQQISDMRHGGRRVDGQIQGELSTVTWDDFLAAAMRSTWAVGVSISQASHTSVAVTGNVFTFGSGSLLTAGLKVGDIVRFSTLPGAPGTQWNAKNLRITALTGTTMTIAAIPAGASNFTAQTTFVLAVQGRKLTQGVLTPSYTIEQSYPDLDMSELFTGCRIGGVSVSIPPNGIAQATFQVLGQQQQVLSGASAPYFTAPTAAPTSGVLTGIEGGIRFNGVEQSIVTQLDLNLSLNLQTTPVIGSTIVPEIFYGRSVVTGQVSFYLADETLLNAFLNESEVDLVATCLASGSAPQDFIQFSMQRVKLSGATKQLAGDGGMIVQAPFQALLRAGGTGTAYDATTLTIQRSN